MAAGINPIAFWDMTIDEILCTIYGLRQHMKWQAYLVYQLPVLIHGAIGGKMPAPQEAFPGLLEPPTPPKPAWQIYKERVLAHSQDYLRNRRDED